LLAWVARRARPVTDLRGNGRGLLRGDEVVEAIMAVTQGAAPTLGGREAGRLRELAA
jgi:hypothetical protein